LEKKRNSQIGLTIADVRVGRARSSSNKLEALAGELDNNISDGVMIHLIC